MDKLLEVSKKETLEHIQKVQHYIGICTEDLSARANRHDESKLHPPELEEFAKLSGTLKDHTFESDEYAENKKSLKKALDHHYLVNSHHPEHYENGIRGMCLLDILEMFCDWKAASHRNKDGDIMKSIEQCQKKFGFSDELADIFRNTAKRF